jgi:UDP-glucose 4-epimerase
MNVLVTGASGFIGSHTCLALLQAGHKVVALDNLCNSSRVSLTRVERIAGGGIPFVEADVRDSASLDAAFRGHRPDAVIHFAGLKSVGESVREPVKYYDNNVGGTICLMLAMQRAGVRRLVFSSSASVYDAASPSPMKEDAALAPSSPYGRSKLMAEQVISDACAADPAWHAVLLRYFNPVGAHESGAIGEDPAGIPNNLMPFLTQVAIGKRAKLSVFGKDYATPDGTGVRDYIHVMDLAEGHVAALDRLDRLAAPAMPINLGTGRGHSVLELLRSFEQATGVAVAREIVARRPGDSALYFADAALAQSVLGWKAKRDLAAMCRDSWRWQRDNPDGYAA